MRFLQTIIFILLTSCSVGPSFSPPCVDVPSNWKNPSCENACFFSDAYIEHWWQIFDDDVLNDLEAQALSNNRDLFVAWKRIDEARALMGMAASEFYPQFNLAPQYSNTEELIQIFGPGGSVFRANEIFYFLPLNLSYEVDLWGKIQDQYNAARYNWKGQIKDYEAVMLSLTSNLATAYYQLRAADSQIDLLMSTIQLRQKAFDINSSRYEEEVIFYADVTLAGEALDSTIAQCYEILRQRAVLENQIAVLIGTPASEFCIAHNPLTGLPVCIPAGIPSEILLRRPDIAEAELEMRSEHANVKYAYSLFFPSLILTATGGFESPVLRDFLRWISRYWMVGATGNQMVFDGFWTQSNLDRQIARFKEASGTYQQTVLIALQEVENSLGNVGSYAKQFTTTEGTVQWAQRSYELYLDRYEAGLTYYIDVVNTENALLEHRIRLNELRGFRFLATIQLIKSLGGGWSSE